MARAQIEKRASAFPLIYFGLITAFLLPWVYTQWYRSVNGDVAWLSICAKRLTEGIPLIKGCYDTNPPLSVWIYAPPVYLSNLTGIELHYAAYLCMFTFIGFAVLSTALILKNWSFVTSPEKNLFLAAFIASTTILSSISFAERDHMIALILVPFVLTQLSITWKINLPKYLTYAVLIVGSTLLLVKPHYGLIAVMLLIHRMVAQKKLALWNDKDFLILSIATVTYMTVLLIWYQDFLDIMLSDIVTYYLPYNNPAKTHIEFKRHAILFLFFVSLLPFVIDKANPKNFVFVSFTLCCAIISLFVFYIQMKGFFYHLLPTFAFLAPGVSLAVFACLKKNLPAKINERLISNLLVIVIFTIIYWRAPLLPDYPTHEDYKKADLTQYIEKNCGTPCRFFVTHENMEIVSQTAFYINGTYTTRFPGYWFIPLLEKKLKRVDINIKEQAIEDKKRFSRYAGEDLSEHKPNLVMVLSTPPEGTEDKPFDYFSYFSEDPKFKAASKKYKKTDEFKTDRGFYFQDTPYEYEYILTWNVFKPFNNIEDKNDGQTSGQSGHE